MFLKGHNSSTTTQFASLYVLLNIHIITTQIKFCFELVVFQIAFVHSFIELGGEGGVRGNVNIL